MKIRLYPDEQYPCYTIAESTSHWGLSVVITKKMYEEYRRVHKEFDKLNAKLEKMYDNAWDKQKRRRNESRSKP